jgi:hypothetical protein
LYLIKLKQRKRQELKDLIIKYNESNADFDAKSRGNEEIASSYDLNNYKAKA